MTLWLFDYDTARLSACGRAAGNEGSNWPTGTKGKKDTYEVLAEGRPAMVEPLLADSRAGWNSDQQTPQIETGAVKDHVIYRRKIAVPKEAAGRAVKVLFGGCTYGAEVFVDDRKVCEHHGAQLPFEADLTGVVEAGRTYAPQVKAYTRCHYMIKAAEGRAQALRQTRRQGRPNHPRSSRRRPCRRPRPATNCC